MKKLFIFLNIILFICVVFLFILHFSYENPPPEKVLKQTPNGPNITAPQVFRPSPKNLSATEIALISGNDLFSPARGVDPESLKPQTTGKEMKHSQLELTGIYNMGPVKGAIISTNAGRGSSNSKKKVFRIGETVEPTSYVLQNINPEKESVIVSLGTTHYVLKLERNDPGSLNRRSKGEAASKARISMSKAMTTPPPARPKVSVRTATIPVTKPTSKRPIKPSPIGKRSPEEMKRIREEILRKMRERSKKKK